MATNSKSNKPKSAKPEPAAAAKPVAKPVVVAAKPVVVAAKPVVVAAKPVVVAAKPVVVAAKPAAKPILKGSAPYEPTQEEIGIRAFEIYVSEGCQEGNELNHWLRAQDELRSQDRK